MERRLVMLGVLAVVAAAAPARAQFLPMAVRLPAYDATQLGAGPIGGLATADDLLMFTPGVASTAAYYPDRDLLTRGRPSPYALPGVTTLDAALAGFDGGTAPDLAWEVSTSGFNFGFAVAWGSAPGALEILADAYQYASHGIAPIRLLPRLEPLMVTTHGQVTSQNKACVIDLKGAKGTGLPAGSACFYTTTYYFSSSDDDPDRDRVHGIRASPAAVAFGMSDAVIPLMRGFRLLWNRTPAGATTVPQMVLDYVDVGTWDPGLPFANLEPSLTLQPGSSCFGVGGLRVDGDAAPDLVFTMRESPGKLLWLHNDGTAAGLRTAVWQSLMTRADLQPIEDPRVLRQIDLAGGPAIALHDLALDQILVISGDGASGFAVQRLPAFGGVVRELWTADLAGTGAADLLAWVVAPGGGQELWVYPDDAAPPTYLFDWSPAPPTTAPLGSDLALSVAATDPGAVVGLVSTTPTATGMTGASFTVPGSALCDDAAPVDLFARASIIRPGDDLGMLQQLQGAVALVAVPTVAVAGSGAPDRLVLSPGEASGRGEGAAWPACQVLGSEPTYAWGGINLPGFAIRGQQPVGSSSAWADFTVPEADFPGILSGALPPALRLVATGPTATSALPVEGTATLPLQIDARTLVAASVVFDSASLAQGEVGMARITLASRIGLPLPRVRAEVRLAGLELAGPLELNDALVTSGTARTTGTLVIEALPAAPATVEIEVPVRSLGSPGGVSVELFSEGGHRLTPEVSPAADAPRLPGCGCGEGGGAGPLAPLLLLIIVLIKVSSPLPHRGRGRGEGAR